MAEDTRVHLDVALVVGAEPIRGTIADAAGPVVEFEGWLELMSAFDTVCARATGASRPDRSGTEHA